EAEQGGGEPVGAAGGAVTHGGPLPVSGAVRSSSGGGGSSVVRGIERGPGGSSGGRGGRAGGCARVGAGGRAGPGVRPRLGSPIMPGRRTTLKPHNPSNTPPSRKADVLSDKRVRLPLILHGR